MVQHSAILARARKEIDHVVGTDRLPTFDDRNNLPYGMHVFDIVLILINSLSVDAVVNETLRYASPTPLGLPHRLNRDDVYEDMYIPEGTLVFANIWWDSRFNLAFTSVYH
jgi:cytochrome P450